jgi:DNA polymerase-1
MYAPVAQALGSDRATAKIAVLAAMYGQTSGPAGEALKDMDRTFAVAMAFLRRAEECGRRGVDLRTHGGRLLRLSQLASALADAGGSDSAVAHGYGRFARNAVVQGAAAELFKAWAATVRAGLVGNSGRIVLCLHDELLVECADSESAGIVALLESALQSSAAWWCAGSGVRFVADISVVQSWADAK